MSTILQRENGPFRTTVSVSGVDGDVVHLMGTVELFGMPCVNMTYGVQQYVPYWHSKDAPVVLSLAEDVERLAGRRFAAVMCGQPLSDLDGA
jgi:hypothetical protein